MAHQLELEVSADTVRNAMEVVIVGAGIAVLADILKGFVPKDSKGLLAEGARSITRIVRGGGVAAAIAGGLITNYTLATSSNPREVLRRVIQRR